MARNKDDRHGGAAGSTRGRWNSEAAGEDALCGIFLGFDQEYARFIEAAAGECGMSAQEWLEMQTTTLLDHGEAGL
ncbi:MAG: hypothetical protein Q4F72_02825 [Desulfovibrionaceae bacterium]|nr:hypothetical protein [Desulfovibrionaceae bacterium]